jgi:hypothetical protein
MEKLFIAIFRLILTLILYYFTHGYVANNIPFQALYGAMCYAFIYWIFDLLNLNE